MTQTSLDVFERTLHKTNTWLNEVMLALPSPDRRDAYRALRATLHALRDSITLTEAAQLGAQLPMLIRGFYYEGWDPTVTATTRRHKEDFLGRIAQELRGSDVIDPEQAACAVFTVLTRRISEGEIEDVKHVLPSELRDLWP
jgi:uncharacterized protein (DUF2267 family)